MDADFTRKGSLITASASAANLEEIMLVSATAPQINSSGLRYHMGFDRWNPTSREGWSVLWRASEHGRFVLGDDQSIWSWDARDRLWRDMPAAQETTTLRDHHLAFNRMRRALLTIRALDSKLESEQEAARLALQRISSAIVTEWRDGPGADGARWSEAWFDHPAALYLAVTRDCRFHFGEAEREPFNPRIFAYLVTAAFDDFNTGRRQQPPRLRAEDMALLETNMTTPADGPTELDTSFITGLREQLAKEDQRQTNETSRLSKWRQKLLFSVGPALIGIAASIALVGYSWKMMTG